MLQIPIQMIPFNKPYMTGKEIRYIQEAHANGILAGDGPFTERCHQYIENATGTARALLTHSCTGALEMSCMLAGLQPGDEVIMPSYTFVSTANAVVKQGATPVFVDIRQDTLNLDETRIEPAITPNTRAILPVHYAGVGCEMDAILDIAKRHKLTVIEDAAQGFMSRYRGQALGSIGDLGALSFHETKNIISGEGGCLLVNKNEMAGPAEIIREKGTDRSRFFRGEVDKYTWQNIGSSYLPGELVAAFLAAQLEQAEAITRERISAWNRYHDLAASLEADGLIKRPVVPGHCEHNGHLYYVIVNRNVDRDAILIALREQGINAVFHYVPLHNSPAGKRFGRANDELVNTSDLSARLIRLPLWHGIGEEQQKYVTTTLRAALEKVGHG